jgi:hypothetical protein
LNKGYESWVLKKQDNNIGFGDPIGDDDSNITTNILISKDTDPKAKLDLSNMKVYNKIKRFNSWFNPEALKVMEGIRLARESMLEGADVAIFWQIVLENQQISMKPTILIQE